MRELVDLALAFAWVLLIVNAFLGARERRRRPRHVWGELRSSDIAHAERRRFRP